MASTSPTQLNTIKVPAATLLALTEMATRLRVEDRNGEYTAAALLEKLAAAYIEESWGVLGDLEYWLAGDGGGRHAQ